MRVPRIYTEKTLSENSEFVLEGAAAHYLVKVLRVQAGRALILFNGDGYDYKATVATTQKKVVHLHTHESHQPAVESTLVTHLAISVSKGDRMDWVIQKASELGASFIHPLFSERSEVKLSGERLQKKLKHWQSIAISACEQSRRTVIPQISDVQQFGDYLGHKHAELKLILHPTAAESLRALSNRQTKSVSILIGPEGGFTDQEVDVATSQGFLSVGLGPRVLRTETAPVAALALAQYLWGDFS